MGTIAPRLILRCTATTKREIRFSFQNISLAIDDLNGSFNTNGTVLLKANLDLIAHELTLIRGSREASVTAMGDEVWTWSWIQSDEFFRE